YIRGHGLEERYAEPLVFTHREIAAPPPVIPRQLLVGYRTRKDEPFVQQPEVGHQSPDHRIVPWHDIVTTDEDEAIVRIDIPFVVLGEADVILGLLVGRNPADEEKIDEPFVQDCFESGQSDRSCNSGCIDRDRKHPRRSESQRLELTAVVLGIAKGQIPRAGQSCQLLPTQSGQPKQRRVVGSKERRRRHVVILQNAPTVQKNDKNAPLLVPGGGGGERGGGG